MAEHTRLKDIAADLKQFQEVNDQRDASLRHSVGRLEDLCTRLDRNSSQRLERMEKSVSEMTNNLESLYSQLDLLLQPQNLGKGVAGMGESGSSSNSYTLRVKIDFPCFDGTNPLDWIFKAEQYFSFYETSDVQKLVLASVHFEGDVVPWYQMLYRSHQIPTWTALTLAIEQQYGPTQFDNP